MFVGRERELSELQRAYDRGGFAMAVIYGRRRVGKTRLIQEFIRDKPALFFTALEQSDEDNLRDLSRAIAEFFRLPSDTTFATWSSALDYLADQAERERFVFVFDEFPYAVRRNESLPSLLQVTIDHRLKPAGAYLILCGSNQGLMESHVLGKKSPLYGRRTIQIRLRPLGYRDAAELIGRDDPQEAFHYYGCFGGVPYYLELLDRDASLWDNLARLYFSPTGFLYDEPQGLLRQEVSEPALYNSVLRAIAGGANRPKRISDRTGIAATTLPRYLQTLTGLGIIERVAPFGENPASGKRSIYRICDACYDFWFRFVMPVTSAVEGGLGGAVVANLPEAQLSEYLGHRFERLCAEWLTDEASAGRLPVPATEVGSWWGTNPAKRAQDDIDVLAADHVGRRLLIGECKYRASFDETAELRDLEAKRDLIPGYTATDTALFSRYPVSDATTEDWGKRSDVHFVTLEDMYREG